MFADEKTEAQRGNRTYTGSRGLVSVNSDVLSTEPPRWLKSNIIPFPSN